MTTAKASPAQSAASSSAGLEPSAPQGPTPINYQAFDQIMNMLEQPDPNPTIVWMLFGKLGPEGQRMVMSDANLGPKLRSVGSTRQDAGAEGSSWGDLVSEGLEIASAVTNPVGWAMDASMGGEDVGSAPVQAPAVAGPAAAGPTVAAATPALETGETGPAAEAGVPYLSQRDNAYEDPLREAEQSDRVKGDNMCNVTCLSMQLLAVCGGPEAVNRRTAELIEEHGGASIAEDDLASRQTEDLLMELFDALTSSNFWDDFKDSKAAPFYKGWYSDVPGGWKFHQAGVCQAYVLRWYKGVGKAENQSPYAAGYVNEQKVTDFKGWFTDVVKPQLASESSMTLSTKLTGGHFVLLTDVLDDGILVHDPYGARGNSGYLKNGSAPTAKFLTAERACLDQRFRENGELAARIGAAAPEAFDAWGERNYFSWDEVAKWKIGISGVLVTGADEAP